MAESDVVLLRRAWEAFARGEVEAATEVLHPQVRWYGAGDDEHEGGCHNRDEALAFIRQALADGVTAKAFDFRDAGDRVVVLLQPTSRRSGAISPRPTARSSRSATARSSRWSSTRPSTRRSPPPRSTADMVVTAGNATRPIAPSWRCWLHWRTMSTHDTELSVSQARNHFSDAVNRAAFGGEITYVTRGRGQQRAAAIVPADLVERYEELVDREDGRIASERLADLDAGRETAVSAAEVTRALER
jgi:antitoxin (DNA-binding transcriptional repressor) of toxin-antitoxin stability system